jgi:small subunit ribosomal protein S17
VHHVVNSILAPFGEPIEARPPVPTVEERIAEREAKKKMKEERRRAERRAERRGNSGVAEIKTEAQEVQEVKEE